MSDNGNENQSFSSLHREWKLLETIQEKLTNMIEKEELRMTRGYREAIVLLDRGCERRRCRSGARTDGRCHLGLLGTGYTATILHLCLSQGAITSRRLIDRASKQTPAIISPLENGHNKIVRLYFWRGWGGSRGRQPICRGRQSALSWATEKGHDTVTQLLHSRSSSLWTQRPVKRPVNESHHALSLNPFSFLS